jgi:hypothetical protein
MQYVADGLKNTPASPTYGQARDGVVTAANASHPEDVPLVWQAFADRGIGEGSVSPASGSFNHAGITESFVAPNAMPDDTIGFTSAGIFFERNVHLGGQADAVLSFGAAGELPIVGNWDGGTTPGPLAADTPGTFVPGAGAWFLRTINASGPADLVFTFGAPNAAHLPVAGDWNGDGVVTIGFFDPATNTFFLRDSNDNGPATLVITFGAGSGRIPIVGDWNNDGIDTVGVYDPAAAAFYLRDANTPGPATTTVVFGTAGLQPVAGDWNGDGFDTIGVYNQATGTFHLKNSLTPGAADISIALGAPGVQKPVFGNFDGQ